MKKFQNLGRSLDRDALRKIKGGCGPDELCSALDGSGAACGDANTYCGSGSGVTCCAGLTCQNAGNGQNPNVPGGDKLCA